MRFWIQTIGFTLTFTVAGAVAFDAASRYAERSHLRAPPMALPKGNPGIPDAMKQSLHDSFSSQ